MKQIVQTLILAGLFALTACGGGGTVMVGNDPVVEVPVPVVVPVDANVPPVLSLGQGSPNYYLVSGSPQMYVEIIVLSDDRDGNAKILGTSASGLPAGIISVTDMNGGAPAITVGFADQNQDAVRISAPVAYGVSYVAQVTLFDTFGNANTITIPFVSPQPPTPTNFRLNIRQGYPKFTASGQSVQTTIIVDSNHELKSAPNGIPWGTMFVSDSTGNVTSTITVGFTDLSHTAVGLASSGHTASSYTATFTLEDMAGSRSTMLVPYTTP